MGLIGSAWTPVPPRPSCNHQLAKNLRALSSTSAWDGQVLKAAGPFIFSLALDQGPFLTNCSLHSTAEAFFLHLYSPKHLAEEEPLPAFALGVYKVEVQGQAGGIRGEEGAKAVLFPPHVH